MALPEQIRKQTEAVQEKPGGRGGILHVGGRFIFIL